VPSTEPDGGGGEANGSKKISGGFVITGGDPAELPSRVLSTIRRGSDGHGMSAPWLSLTPGRYQSGRTDIVGHITKAGDASVRTALYKAATTLIGRVSGWSSLKSWGVRLARRSGVKKARVAVARKLAVVLLTMWRSQMPFRWTTKLEAAPN
jgi:Transposase IS116/IS110/IS902 family